MATAGVVRSVMIMNRLKNLQWPLIIGLGALALVRPFTSIVEHQTGLDGGPTVPIIETIVITVIWVLVVGLSRTPHPLVALALTGLVYAVLSIILSGLLSPILSGELQGPLAMPIAIIPVMITNLIWGLVAGAIALGLQRVRGVRDRDVRSA